MLNVYCLVTSAQQSCMKGGKRGRWTCDTEIKRTIQEYVKYQDWLEQSPYLERKMKFFMFMNFIIYFHIYCCLGNIIQLLNVASCVQSEQFHLSWVNTENIGLKLCLNNIVQRVILSYYRVSVKVQCFCVQIQCLQADILQRGAAVTVWHGGAILVLHHHQSSASINIPKFSVKTSSAF